MIRPGLSLAFGALLLSTAAIAGADDISSFPGIDQLPAGYAPIQGFIAGLGIPYAPEVPTELPTKPIYWIHKDKIIGFEVVMDEKQLIEGDPLTVQPIAGLPPVDHVKLQHDFGFAITSNPTLTLRVEFVSEYFLERMF